MFIDQLLTCLFLLFLLSLQLLNSQPSWNLFLYKWVNWSPVKLIFNYIVFYFTYIFDYMVHTCTLTKWVSCNYSDAYWALYSSKLNLSLNNLTFKLK